MGKIKIFVVEDYLLTRMTYKHAFKNHADIELVQEFETAEKCIEALETENADIILMDLGLPYMSGIDATKIIHKIHPNIKIIIMTSHDDDNEILASFASGANAYALKDLPLEELYSLIFTVNQGAIWVDPKISNVLLKNFSNINMNKQKSLDLSEQEVEILKLHSYGLSDLEIAQKISTNTYAVKEYVCDILNKLSITDSVQKAVKSVKYDL